MTNDTLEFADIDLGEIDGLEIEVLEATNSTGAAEGATSRVIGPVRACSCSCSCDYT